MSKLNIKATLFVGIGTGFAIIAVAAAGGLSVFTFFLLLGLGGTGSAALSKSARSSAILLTDGGATEQVEVRQESPSSEARIEKNERRKRARNAPRSKLRSETLMLKRMYKRETRLLMRARARGDYETAARIQRKLDRIKERIARGAEKAESQETTSADKPTRRG